MESKRFRPLQPTGMCVLHGSTCVASTLVFFTEALRACWIQLPAQICKFEQAGG